MRNGAHVRQVALDASGRGAPSGEHVAMTEAIFSTVWEPMMLDGCSY
jgi:hypothetical protein